MGITLLECLLTFLAAELAVLPLVIVLWKWRE